MGDGPRGIEVFPDHFQASTSGAHPPQTQVSPVIHQRSDFESGSRVWARRKLRTAASMLNLFSIRKLPWVPGQEKVLLTAPEVESLRTELADLEEKEALLKAQLEHLDEVLRSARLSGYLYMRTRWATLPGEPAPIDDDTEIDDWLPRFLVLHGSCIYLYLMSTDLSPQDSTLLSDVVEVGRLPCFTREDGEFRHNFYILTRQGLRYECSSVSKIQVDSWLTALHEDCKLQSDTLARNDSEETLNDSNREERKS